MERPLIRLEPTYSQVASFSVPSYLILFREEKKHHPVFAEIRHKESEQSFHFLAKNRRLLNKKWGNIFIYAHV